MRTLSRLEQELLIPNYFNDTLFVGVGTSVITILGVLPLDAARPATSEITCQDSSKATHWLNLLIQVKLDISCLFHNSQHIDFPCSWVGWALSTHYLEPLKKGFNGLTNGITHSGWHWPVEDEARLKNIWFRDIVSKNWKKPECCRKNVSNIDFKDPAEKEAMDKAHLTLTEFAL